MNIGDRLIDPMKGPVTVVDVKEDVELKVDATGDILIRSPHWVAHYRKNERCGDEVTRRRNNIFAWVLAVTAAVAFIVAVQS